MRIKLVLFLICAGLSAGAQDAIVEISKNGISMNSSDVQKIVIPGLRVVVNAREENILEISQLLSFGDYVVVEGVLCAKNDESVFLYLSENEYANPNVIKYRASRAGAWISIVAGTGGMAYAGALFSLLANPIVAMGIDSGERDRVLRETAIFGGAGLIAYLFGIACSVIRDAYLDLSINDALQRIQ